MWIEIAARQLGVGLANYAVGGATTGAVIASKTSDTLLKLSEYINASLEKSGSPNRPFSESHFSYDSLGALGARHQTLVIHAALPPLQPPIGGLPVPQSVLAPNIFQQARHICNPVPPLI